MKSTYTIENLTNYTVAIKILTEDNGKKKKYRRSYCNSNYDRTELQGMLPEKLFSDIIAMWGDSAMIPDLQDPRVAASEEESEEEKKEE